MPNMLATRSNEKSVFSMPNILVTRSNGKNAKVSVSMLNILATETWNLKADNSETYVYIDRRSDLRG